MLVTPPILRLVSEDPSVLVATVIQGNRAGAPRTLPTSDLTKRAVPGCDEKRPRERCQAPPATGPPNAERTWRGFPPTIVYSGGTPWTCKHEEWLRRHRFDAVLAATAARDRLDEQILVVAASPRFADPVNRLGCLRGISALTGLALTVEIGDWSRFTGSSIGAYVGLVPSEFASGTSRVQGSITKAGNTHVRRLLIESAWHHRKFDSPLRGRQD